MAERHLRSTFPLAAAVLAAAALIACDGTGPPTPPAAIEPGSLPLAVSVGDTLEDVTVTVTDAQGAPVTGVSVAWTAGAGGAEPAVSETDGSGVARTRWILGTTAGAQSLVAAAGELSARFDLHVAPGPLAELQLSPGDTLLESLGDTLLLAAAAADAYGNEIAVGGFAWTSSAPAVASVADGVVVTHAEGAAEITLSGGGRSATAAVRVEQTVAGVAVDPAAPVLVKAETLRLTARAVDARGFTVDTALAVTWSSTAPAVASVDASGLVEAIGVGAAGIVAAAGEHAGQASIDVRAGPRPGIAAVSPAVISAGDTVVIDGTGFSTTPGDNAVTVAGVGAAVLSATSTRLTAALPPDSAFACAPTGPREVVVAVDGLDAHAEHPVAGARRHSLAVGESIALLPGTAACNELAEAGSYVVSVFNASASPATLTAFTLRGTAPAAAATRSAAAVRPPRPRITLDGAAPDPNVDAPDPARATHERLLESGRQLAGRLGAPGGRPGTGAAAAASAATAPAAVPTLGDTRTFRVPDLTSGTGFAFCTNYITVTARAVYVGETGIVWEDVDAPLAGTMDDRWTALGEEFDTLMAPVLREHYGDPLVFDGQLDADERLSMLFTPAVNDFDLGLAGFVFSGDFYLRSQCPSSDRGELFYGYVPTVAGAGYEPGTVDYWYWTVRSVVIHEVKHITSYAHAFRDFSGGTLTLEEQWLEEAGARLAEEHFARALFGYGTGDNVTYEESLWCERRVGTAWPECDPFPAIMISHFVGVNQYYRAIETLTPIGRATSGDWSFYGSGWLLLRWAIDHSDLGESAFTRALIDEDVDRGVANLVARTGRPFAELLADFSLAIALDDHPTGVAPSNPRLAFPSWDTRDVFQGLHEDTDGSGGGSSFDRPWPLAGRTISPGDFDLLVDRLRGGTASLLEIAEVPAAGQLLELLGGTGGTTPPQLGVAIVRVQ